jgi:5'-3' exoribonuclease 2
MGIPSMFRWISKKYPKIVSQVIEEQPQDVGGLKIPVDVSGPNPNGEEFDNLYLDMNGIVHPCSHPEDRPPPQNEEEMMIEIFKYTERVFNMVRPRKILMIAVGKSLSPNPIILINSTFLACYMPTKESLLDGVAPRAKMNQQRSRRFRSAQEAKEKDADKAELLKMLKSQSGGHVDDSTSDSMNKKTWDSNAITPGTPFMDILAASLRYWTAYKLNTDPAWANVKVIISDAQVPGEGEHKIMEFIRSQRSSAEHNPNTRHVIYGLDADLIMLGLATHEPHFRVLREDVFFQESHARACRICGQKGHEARECRGQPKEKDGEFDEKDRPHPLKPFIWLHVSILREYLEAELYVQNQPFRFDLERAIDDWVFMCFFVGNDFLPHLPSLDIREDGIDTLIAIWRDNIPYMGGYLTKDGHVDLERAQLILNGLAKQEDAIFRRRRQTEERRDANAKRRKIQEQSGNDRQANSKERLSGTSNISEQNTAFPLFIPGNMVSSITKESRSMTYDMVVNRGAAQKAIIANKSAAAALKNQLLGGGSSNDDNDSLSLSSTPVSASLPPVPDASHVELPVSALGKRKAELLEDDGDSTPGRNTPDPTVPSTPTDEASIDTVRLWEEGYADRYYEQKFKADPRDHRFRHKVAGAYVEGLTWVLLYYFQGCPSWEWYYPYHYAPFAADFVGLADLKISFEKGRIFKPFEQLMGVLPAASRHAIPEIFHDLMTEEDSEIIDFYPEDFPIDLNGKKFAWQGVALLPWIDSKRLLTAMEKLYPLLPPEEAARNVVGKDVLLVSEANQALYSDIATNFYSKKPGPQRYNLNPRISGGLAGKVEKNETYLPHGSLKFPLKNASMPDLDEDRTIR